MPTKVRLVKAMVFPMVMYGCESWTIRKADCFLWLSTQPTKRRAYVFRWDWVKFDYRVGWRKYLSQSTQNPVVSCLLGWRVDFSA